MLDVNATIDRNQKVLGVQKVEGQPNIPVVDIKSAASVDFTHDSWRVSYQDLRDVAADVNYL